MILRYLVSGRVQGVGYRWFVWHRCTELQVSGYVRNLDSGKVEVLVSGNAKVQAEVEAVLTTGPPGAKVTTVEKFEILDESPSLTAFRILN